VASLVVAGDLRDFRKAGRVLDVDFIPIGTLRQKLLYEGDALLGEPLAGVDASLSYYRVADSGWVDRRDSSGDRASHRISFAFHRHRTRV
jgi:hypothetical protein